MTQSELIFKQQNITPDLANGMLAKNTSNRPLSRSTVERYAKLMMQRKWLETGDPIRFDKDGTLLDGQHRLAACVKSGFPFTCFVIYNVEQYCFQVMDTGKKRSASDVLAIDNVKYYTDTAAIVKFLLIMHRTDNVSSFSSGSNIENYEVLEYYNNNKDISEVAALLKGKYKKVSKMLGVACAGSLFYKFQKIDPNLAHEIYGQLSATGDINSASGAFKFREKFIDLRLRGVSFRGGMKALFLIRIWNNYRSNKKRKMISFDKQDYLPEIL